MSDLINNLKAVKDATLASQPGVNISQLLNQIQAAMNKAIDLEFRKIQNYSKIIDSLNNHIKCLCSVIKYQPYAIYSCRQ